MTLQEQYGCPSDVNFRFWLFALSTGAEKWENNVDFMSWISTRMHDDGAKPLLLNGRVADHAEFDKHLASTVTLPTEAQLAKARQYFDTMPSRQQ